MEQGYAFLTGTFIGLSTLLFIGPVFFYLLKSTVEVGVKAGVSVALGIIVGDLICVFALLFGDFDFLRSGNFQKWFSLLGAILLIFYAYHTLSNSKKDQLQQTKSNSAVKAGFVGFSLNFINPFVFAVWLGFGTILDHKFESKEEVQWAFFGILFIIFATDLLKVFLAKKLIRFLNPLCIKRLGYLTSVVMFLFAARLLFHFFSI